jgi:hypothetical protein
MRIVAIIDVESYNKAEALTTPRLPRCGTDADASSTREYLARPDLFRAHTVRVFENCRASAGVVTFQVPEDVGAAHTGGQARLY